MRRGKLLAMVLACSMIFGQTAWAAESQTTQTRTAVESTAEEELTEYQGEGDTGDVGISKDAIGEEEISGENASKGESLNQRETQEKEDPEMQTPNVNDTEAQMTEKPDSEENTKNENQVVKEENPEPAKETDNVETKKVTIHYQGDDRLVEIDENVHENMASVESSDSGIASWDHSIHHYIDYSTGEPQDKYYAGIMTESTGSAVLEFLDSEGNVLAKYEITVVYTEIIAYPGMATVFKPSQDGFPVDDNKLDEWEVISSDPSVCTGTLRFPDMNYDGSSVIAAVALDVGKTGSTLITINYMGSCMYKFQVNVPQNEKPDDIVAFKDPMLLYGLLETTLWDNGDGYSPDVNGDGYLSKTEMKKFEAVEMSYYKGITDLTGLEYAENLTYLGLEGQSELVNVDSLFKLEKLARINLRGTGVSIEDRFKLADFKNKTMVKGEMWSAEYEAELFDDPFEFELSENNSCVQQIEQYGIQYLLGIEVGETGLRISNGGQSVDIQIRVEGIDCDQPIGADSDVAIKTTGGQRILDSNGALWELYPEKKKVKENVSNYVAGWVYSGNESAEYKNYTDSDGTLWSDEGKLAENIVKFTGHYALNDEGVLKDIYGSQGTEITNVKSWIEYRRYIRFDEENMTPQWNTTTYVLKNDGTLWSRTEVEKNVDVNEFEQIRTDVKDMNDVGYLTEDGSYYAWRDTSEPMLTSVDNIEYIGEGMNPNFYTSTDGNAYILDGIDNYVSVGKVKLKDVVSSEGVHYYLTDKNELYRFNNGVSEKLADDVMEIQNTYYEGDAYYRTISGEYRRLSDCSKGTQENPIKIDIMGVYQLYDTGVEGDYELVRNNVVLLNHVNSILYVDTDVYFYALRTDGTLWELDEIPKQILELGKKVLAGDLDGNGVVNVSDLRMTLRSVCGKIKLTSEQTEAADVEKDDKNIVDVKDLRKMLRFVCGKIESLS